MARKRRNAKVLSLNLPTPILLAVRALSDAMAAESAHADRPFVGDGSMRDIALHAQRAASIRARAMATFYAWQRQQPWATEERFRADVRAYVDFVRATYTPQPIAEVIDLAAAREARRG